MTNSLTPLGFEEIVDRFGLFLATNADLAASILHSPKDATDKEMACHILYDLGLILEYLKTLDLMGAIAQIRKLAVQRKSPLLNGFVGAVNLQTLNAESAANNVDTASSVGGVA